MSGPHLAYWVDELAAYVGSHREAQRLAGDAAAPRPAPPARGALITQAGRDLAINGVVPIIERDDL